LRSTWLWHSRAGSPEQDIFSVLAAAEVMLAVTAYWSFALWAHTQTHLLISAIAAPLLLLRSKQSIDLGLRWYKFFDFSTAHDGSWHSSLIKKIFASSLSFRFQVPLVLLVLAAGMGLGFLVALPIRIIATAAYLLPGISSLSANWWRTLFATDLLTRPEIIPGHTDTSSAFHFDQLAGDITGRYFNKRFASAGVKNRYLRGGLTLLVSVSAVAAYAVVLGPAYLYRMSIKSTAWAHWPLAYISRPLRFADDPEELRLRLWTDAREWLRRVVMIITLLGAFVASVPSLATIKEAFPAGAVSIIEYAVLIDLKTLVGHPWRLVALISAGITLALTWYGLELSLLMKRASARPERLISARRWASGLEYAIRIRDVCGWAFWGLVFVHAGLWLIPSTSWLPEYLKETLRFIYGEYLPPAVM
jgi:hypothetical protein